MSTQISSAYHKILNDALQLPTSERVAIIAELTVSVQQERMSLSEGEIKLSADSLEALLKVEPLSPKEILEKGLLGTWSEQVSLDGADWVNKRKEQRRAKQQWSSL